jgi:hypothetical protein
MTKYHAKLTIIDGIKFASKKEASRYAELKLLQKAGIIKTFSLQPEFVLQEGYRRKDGKAIRAIKYIADFKVEYPDGHIEIEDTKGMQTDVFKLKRKLLEAKYDLILKIL